MFGAPKKQSWNMAIRWSLCDYSSRELMESWNLWEIECSYWKYSLHDNLRYCDALATWGFSAHNTLSNYTGFSVNQFSNPVTTSNFQSDPAALELVTTTVRNNFSLHIVKLEFLRIEFDERTNRSTRNQL